MMRYKWLFSGFFILTSYLSIAQNSNDNIILDSKVKTVILTKAGTEDRYAMIGLNTAEQLRLSFDVLGTNRENFQYTVIHCDANWQPTDLNKNQYLKGMDFDNITDWKFSSNTYTKYVHYNLLFPNETIKPYIAGNYIIKVYRNFDEENVVLIRRFMIVNQSTQIEASAHPPTLAEFRFTKQEVNFTVEYNANAVPNPLQDIKIVVLQNYRWDNALTGLKPQFSTGTKLDYNYVDKTLFNGGNEFRFFDIRSLRTYSQNVRTKWIDSVVHLMLMIDESKGSNQYFQYTDFNGKRLIQNKDGLNGDIDGDYAITQFYLSSPGTMNDEDVYVFGELTDWKLLPEYKMYFNRNRARYELEMTLKQGRYEYCYATKGADGRPDETPYEGNHFQTENEYLILVYTKNQQWGYDELIGTRLFKSNNQ